MSSDDTTINEQRPPLLEAYAFWIRRPHDTQAWPTIFLQADIAHRCPYRVSPVTHVLQFEHAPLNVPKS